MEPWSGQCTHIYNMYDMYMLWSQPIAKHIYIDIYMYIYILIYMYVYVHIHTYRGWFYDQNRTFSLNFEPLKLLVGYVDTMIHLWFIYGSKQAYTLLLSNSQFWANQERGPWTKQCPNSDESKFKRLQFHLHIYDYLWLSLSLIRLCELQTLIVPWKQNAYKHSVFFVSTFQNNQCSSNIPKISKKNKGQVNVSITVAQNVPSKGLPMSEYGVALASSRDSLQSCGTCHGGSLDGTDVFWLVTSHTCHLLYR